jgi:transcriptional regulator with XRE-family HTH domain
MESVSMRDDVENVGGTRFDADHLLAARPDLKRRAAVAAAIAAVGDLVRRCREADGLTQPELAERTGITQPSLSDLERGVGINGPTTATLVRIFAELSDQLVITSRSELDADRDAEVVAAGQALADALGRIATVPDAGIAKITATLEECCAQNSQNIPLVLMVQGMLWGMQAASNATRPTSLRINFAVELSAAAIADWRHSSAEQGAYPRLFADV